MNFFMRIAITVVLVMLDFYLVNWAVTKLVGWTIEWGLIWFILICLIEYLVIVNLVYISTYLIAIPMSNSMTQRQFFINKWAALIIAWCMCMLYNGLIFHFVDFSFTKGCITGVMVIVLNLSIPFTIMDRIKPLQQIADDAFKNCKINMENEQKSEKPAILDAKAILKGLVLHQALKASEQIKDKKEDNSLPLNDGKSDKEERR